MELHQIRHFIAVAEAGGFTKAAGRLSVSQPALSASVAKLESELGIRLFDRTRRRVLLTLPGQRLLDAARAALHVLNTARSELKSDSSSRLRLAIGRTTPTTCIANLVSAFGRAYPNVEVQLVEAEERDICRYLEQRRSHLALSVLPPQDRKFNSRALFEEPYLLMVSKRHRFARHSSISIAQLDREPYILRTCCDFHDETAKALAERGIKPRIVYRTDQDDRALALVTAGIGVTLMPSSYRSPDVAAVNLSDLKLTCAVGFRWMRELNSDPVRKFIEFASDIDWRARDQLR